MLGLFHSLTHIPNASNVIWDHACPNLARHALSDVADIIRLDTTSTKPDVILFIPPISGHSSALVQDLAKPMQDTHDVHVIDWHDPAIIDADLADYGHEDQVDCIKETIELILETTGKLHVVAICQSASPTLLALDAAQSPNVTLTLVAAPLFDAPGGVNDLFCSPEIAKETILQAAALSSTVMNGAKVLPAGTQLGAIMHGPGGALRLLGTCVTQECMPLLTDISTAARMRRMSLLDARNIPQKLLLEGLISNFVNRDHLRARIDHRIPVHLIGSTADTVVPWQQTGQFEKHFPHLEVHTTRFSELDHFDLFVGSSAKSDVVGKMKEFFKAHSDMKD